MLFWGEKTTTVASVKMRKLNWNISFKVLAKNRGKRSINCDPKLHDSRRVHVQFFLGI